MQPNLGIEAFDLLIRYCQQSQDNWSTPKNLLFVSFRIHRKEAKINLYNDILCLNSLLCLHE